jgi:hypothetical protein
MADALLSVSSPSLREERKKELSAGAKERKKANASKRERERHTQKRETQNV